MASRFEHAVLDGSLHLTNARHIQSANYMVDQPPLGCVMLLARWPVHRRRALFGAAGALVIGIACQGDVVGPPPSPATVSITPSTATIGVGVVVQFTASDRSGNRIDGSQIVWRSSDPTIASVSPAGVVAGVTSGTAQVTASVAGTMASAAISVTAAVQSTGRGDAWFRRIRRRRLSPRSRAR